MVVWHDLRSDFRLEAINRPEVIPAHLRERVNRIWQERLATNPNLYDGPIYAMLKYTSELVTCYRTSYRYLAAARQDLVLGADLVLDAIGVTGILTCRDGLVLGRRSNTVDSNQARWELAPAGSLSQESANAQLIEELHEELGIPECAIETNKAVGIAHDPDDRVYDLLIRLHVSLTEQQVLDDFNAHGSTEYSKLVVLPLEGISDFVAEQRQNLVPLVVPALIGAGMLPQL
jgi:hypothetical protein